MITNHARKRFLQRFSKYAKELDDLDQTLVLLFQLAKKVSLHNVSVNFRQHVLNTLNPKYGKFLLYRYQNIIFVYCHTSIVTVYNLYEGSSIYRDLLFSKDFIITNKALKDFLMITDTVVESEEHNILVNSKIKQRLRESIQLEHSEISNLYPEYLNALLFKNSHEIYIINRREGFTTDVITGVVMVRDCVDIYIKGNWVEFSNQSFPLVLPHISNNQWSYY